MDKNQNKFNFFVPIEFEKGRSSGDDRPLKIKGVCSSITEDTDGETLEPSGFDFKPLLEKGFLNWNHQGNKTSSAIIGRPTMAKVINDGKDFYIEGYLYKGLEEAQSVYNLAKVLEEEDPDRRLGFSIEGQAMERDFLNPKRIKKARITGVAITACPKNPNTLLSIMKGEYSDPFIEEEIIEEVEKAMVAGSTTGTETIGISSQGEALKVESVEGEKKVLEEESEEEKKRKKRKLKKSEIYNLIASKYTRDIEKAKKIYSFIEQVNQKLFNNMNTEITVEAIEKSYSILDSEFQLLKSENSSSEVTETEKVEDTVQKSEEVEVTETTPVVEEVPVTEDATIVKSEDAEDDDTKAYNMAKGCIEGGMTKDKAVEDMIRKGMSLVASQTAVEKVISEAEALKENGGAVTSVQKSEVDTDLLVKSFEDKLSNTEANIQNNLNELVKSLGSDLQSRFIALGSILKTPNPELISTIEELKKSNEELQGRLESIEQTPIGRRAVTSVRAIDRTFEKSNDSEINEENTYQLSKSEDVKALTDRLFNEYAIIKSKGGEDLSLSKGIQNLEISRAVEPQFLKKLNAMGIKVTR